MLLNFAVVGRALRIILAVAAVGILGYAATLAYFYNLMLRPPEEFALAWAGTSPQVRRIVPMPPLWKRARAGQLDIGDKAPDFSLWTPDHSRQVQLSQFAGSRPVVLVFGSYT